MATVRQAVERLYERGTLPMGESVSVKTLRTLVSLSPFPSPPTNSVRAITARIFDSVSTKLPWAIILCQFKGWSPDPDDPDPKPKIEKFFRSIFTPGTGGMIEYWRDVSFGSVDVYESRVFGWVELEITRKQAGGIGRRALIDHAIKAAKNAGLDPITGFHSQVAVFTHDCAIKGDCKKNGEPDWSNWIDGSASGKQFSAPPHGHYGNFIAHEMAHGFDMDHDLASNLKTEYGDPYSITSSTGAKRFSHPNWGETGPALSLPHLIQKGWMYQHRVYFDNGEWMKNPGGITLPLASITDVGARANLGIRLTCPMSNAQDYYLEYVKPTDWNKGIGDPVLVVRTIAFGGKPAYLGKVDIPTIPGIKAEFVEPLGNTKFQVERFDAGGRIVKVAVKKL
jgi:hypothetical protein